MATPRMGPDLSDEEVLALSTQSDQSVLSDEELKRLEDAAAGFGIGQAIPTKEQMEAAKARFDAPDPQAEEIEALTGRSEALGMIRDVPLVGGFLEWMAEKDPEIEAEIEAEDTAEKEEQLEGKYGESGEGFMRLDPELGMVRERRDPETGEPKVIAQTEEGIEKEELKQRIEDVQEKTSGFASPYSLLQSEETAGVPEGTIDYTAGAYGTAQAALAAISLDPTPISYGADMVSAGLYKLEGDDVAAADVLRWTLYGAGAGAAVGFALRTKRVLAARKGLIDEFVGAGKSADDAADMADGLLVEARNMQLSIERQARRAKDAGVKVAKAEDGTEKIVEAAKVPFEVSPSGRWTSGLIEAAATIPKKNGIDQFLSLKTMPDGGVMFSGSFTRAQSVSPNEIKATGLYDWLQDLKAEGRTHVSRDEVLGYLDANRVDFKTIGYGAPTGEVGKEYNKLKDAVSDSLFNASDEIETVHRAMASTDEYNVDIAGLNHMISIDPDQMIGFVDSRGTEALNSYFDTLSYGTPGLFGPFVRMDVAREKKFRETLSGFFDKQAKSHGTNISFWDHGNWKSSDKGKAFEEKLLDGSLQDEAASIRDHYGKALDDLGVGRRGDQSTGQQYYPDLSLSARARTANWNAPEARNKYHDHQVEVFRWLERNDPEVRELIASRRSTDAADAAIDDADDIEGLIQEVVLHKYYNIINHYGKGHRAASASRDAYGKTRSTLGKRVEHSLLSLPERVLEPGKYKAAVKQREESFKINPWDEGRLRYGTDRPPRELGPTPGTMDVEFEELERLAIKAGMSDDTLREYGKIDDIYNYLNVRSEATRAYRSDAYSRFMEDTNRFNSFSMDRADVKPPRFPSAQLEGGVGNPTYREALIQYDSKALRIAEDPELDDWGIKKEVIVNSFDSPEEYAKASQNERWAAARPRFVEKYGPDFPEHYRDYMSWVDEHSRSKLYTDAIRGGQASHHRDPNIMVHLRMTDHYTRGPDGRVYRILVFQEIQSDWHQKARKAGGYKGQKIKLSPEQESLRLQHQELYDEANRLAHESEESVWDALTRNGIDVHEMERLDPDFELVYDRHTGFEGTRGSTDIQSLVLALDDASQKDIFRWADNFEHRHGNLERVAQNQASFHRRFGDDNLHIPHAPFERSKDWSDIGVREGTRIAVEDGYDGVAFIGGEMARYSSNMPSAASKVHYGKIVPGAFKRVTGRSLAPMELIQKPPADGSRGKTFQEHLVDLGKGNTAADLGKEGNAFNGILFDDELRKTMSQPQRFTGKPPKGRK